MSKFGYACRDCGEWFYEPEFRLETHGLDSPPYEELLVCPHCKSPDIVESPECDCCGVAITDYFFATEDGQCFCKHCLHREEL